MNRISIFPKSRHDMQVYLVLKSSDDFLCFKQRLFSDADQNKLIELFHINLEITTFLEIKFASIDLFAAEISSMDLFVVRIAFEEYQYAQVEMVGVFAYAEGG
jgi:hypothetical protein